jgi:excisionase family DNA binding protein
VLTKFPRSGRLSHVTPQRERPLTLRQVAEKLGASEKSVRRWADDGVIPCFRTPGRHRRFHVEDIDRFMEEAS